MRTYRNPIARHGDFADPFVLRHDGRYYLYATNPDVRCWSSADLVEWQLEGATIAEDEFPGLVPFAPEVVYADGAFWMYTSPSGHGHFVLRSGSPTGPFRTASANVGHSIDGNILIDDDGRWYFYWAGDEGIWGCEMPSPTEFGTPVLTGIHMNGWTEGPFVSKRDGAYFMTLTGNHYLSRGYRIDAASSTHPLTGWVSDPGNPILVATEGPVVGLGHSSSVIGPDLVSTYLAYHNLNPDASRDLNIDRQVWNGRSLEVLGPTSSAPRPAMPDVVGDPLEVGEDGVFTAELNLTATGTVFGVRLAAPGGDVLLEARVDGADTVIRVADAVAVAGPLPPGFRSDALHCWRVTADGTSVRVHLDGRLLGEVPLRVPADARLEGFAVDGEFRVGFCALTRSVPDVADRRAPRPVPGRFWAAATEVSDGAVIRDADGGRYRVVELHIGGSVASSLHVQDAGSHRLHLTGEFSDGDVLEIEVGGRPPMRVVVERTSRLVRTDVDLVGAERLVIRAVAGRPVLARIEVTAASEPAPIHLDDLQLTAWGKHLVGADALDDFTLTATVAADLRSPGSHADLLLRVTHPAEGGEGDDTRLGIHFFRGYSVQLHADRIVFARHAYDERVLAERAIKLEPSTAHELVVRADGGRFDVDLDGTSVLTVDDDLPYVTGRVGSRAVDADTRVHELHLESQQPTQH